MGEKKKTQDEENQVPQSRLNKVVAERNELRTEVESLKEWRKKVGTALSDGGQKKEGAQDPAANLNENEKKLYDTLKESVQQEVLKDLEGREKDAAERIMMEKKYDGEDGLPKYDEKKVGKYAKEHSLSREEAYKLLNQDAILDKKIKEQTSKNPYFSGTSLQRKTAPKEKVDLTTEEGIEKALSEMW